jgi:hypothetical protein
MANFNNQVPEEKNLNSLSPRHHVIDHRLSLTGSD